MSIVLILWTVLRITMLFHLLISEVHRFQNRFWECLFSMLLSLLFSLLISEVHRFQNLFWECLFSMLLGLLFSLLMNLLMSKENIRKLTDKLYAFKNRCWEFLFSLVLLMSKENIRKLTDKLYTFKNRYWWFLFSLLIVLLIIILIYMILNESSFLLIWQNYLEEKIPTHKIIMESANGYIDIYYLTEKKKIKKLKSYPIELILVYDFACYNSKNRILKEILKHQFLNCEIEAKPVACKTISFADNKKLRDEKYDVLNGETFGGLYKTKNIHFKFIYFIQDADGFNLDKMDKLWPLLDKIIENTRTKNYFKSNLHNNLDAKLRIDMKTLKIRNGIITEASYETDILVKYYKENYKWRPTMLLTQGNRKCYLIILDLPMNTFYVNIFKGNHNLKYLKKIYDIDYINDRLRFVIHWVKKYDGYDWLAKVIRR